MSTSGQFAPDPAVEAGRVDDPAPVPSVPAADPTSAPPATPQGLAGLSHLLAVMEALRAGCPWDAEQTHQSLLPYLIEETAEVVEAVEAGDDQAMREELGDLLFEIVFQAQLASERGAFDLDQLARQVADKLVARHPYVFAQAETPDDLMGSWERRKRLEKGRQSAVDGIPEPLSALARAVKVVSRARHHQVPLALPDQPLTAERAGQDLLDLVARAQASGVDADQALRGAVRRLEANVRAAEAQA